MYIACHLPLTHLLGITVQFNKFYSILFYSILFYSIVPRVIIKAGSKGRKSGPKIGSKFGQSNNNTKLAPIGMKCGT